MGYDDEELPADDGLSDDEYEAVYEQHRNALYEQLMTYADEHELSDSFVAQIVSDIGLSLRMVAYASETEKPSVGGLRLDLDRFARELGDSVREAKKSAADFIAEARRARDEDEVEANAADGSGDTRQ